MTMYRRGAFLAAALIVVFQCFVPPIVGLADNADFLIIAQRFSLDVTNPDDPDRYFAYLNNHYKLSDNPPWVPTVLTSEVLLEVPGFLISQVISKTGHYDIRWPGLTHSALFLLGVYWLLPLLERLSRWPRRIATGVMILILTDVAYVSYFNSLYTDAASLVTLVPFLACLGRFVSGHDRSRRAAWILMLFAVLFITSKVQHAVLGLPIFAFLLWQRQPLRAALGKRDFALALTLIVAAVALMGLTTPSRYKGMAVYNIVFHHLLPIAPDPSKSLRELGLPESYLALKGTHAFSNGTRFFEPEFQETWLKQASYASLLRFYLVHPTVPLGLLAEGVDASRTYRTRFGNFLKSSGLGAGAKSEAFAIWSSGKQWLFTGNDFLHWVYTLLPAALLIWAMHARRFAGLHAARPMAYLLVVMAFVELAVGSMSDVRDTSRHLFLYTFLQDLIAIAAIAVICYGSQRKAVLR